MNLIRKSILDAYHYELVDLSRLYAVPVSSFYRSLVNNRDLHAQKITKEIIEKVVLSPEIHFNKMDFMGCEKNKIDLQARSLRSKKLFLELNVHRYSTHGPNCTPD